MLVEKIQSGKISMSDLWMKGHKLISKTINAGATIEDDEICVDDSSVGDDEQQSGAIESAPNRTHTVNKCW